MLKVMRKHAKYFYVLFVLVILSFIFWGIGPGDDNSSAVPVAMVGDEQIGLEEYWRAVDNMNDIYREVYKDKFDEEMQEQIKQSVLSAMIDDRVLLIAAEEAGITVTDRELQEAIMNEPAFQREGTFSSDIYRRTLELNRMTPVYYEQMKRRELVLEKMKRLIKEAVNLAPSELEQLPKDEEAARQMEDVLLEQKREAALRSYVNGLKRQFRIKVNPELIS